MTICAAPSPLQASLGPRAEPIGCRTRPVSPAPSYTTDGSTLSSSPVLLTPDPSPPSPACLVSEAFDDLSDDQLVLAGPLNASDSKTESHVTVAVRPRDRVMSRDEVSELVAQGHVVVIYDGAVLKLDDWIERHPGGRLPLLQMVGVDATSEIAAYHSPKTLRMMSAYRIGRIAGQWANLRPPIRGGVFRTLEHGRDEGQQGTTTHVSTLDALSCSTLDRDRHILDAMDAERERGLAEYPSLDLDTQSSISARFRALHQRVYDEGFYRCDYANYAHEAVRYVTLFALFVGSLQAEWYCSSALFLGCFWQQIMFTAHDAGHRGITQRFVTDTLIGIFIADFCCGLSIGWWKSSHNVHHLVTNAPEHDPDIQNTPLFATCPSQFTTLHSTYYNFQFVWDKACEVMVPYQKYAYYPVMSIARFNLYLLSWCHLLSPRSRPLGAAAWTRPVELVAMACYWFIFGYVLVLKTLPDWRTRVAFVLVSHMGSMVLHVQITLSHWGMPTCDLGDNESFAQRQLRTTMDIVCPPWLDWVHGGLQFQAIHHLFPRVPRHNLRKLQPLVQDFCNDTGIRYSQHGFVDGNARVLGRLGEMSRQLAMLGRCQAHMAATGESGLH